MRATPTASAVAFALVAVAALVPRPAKADDLRLSWRAPDGCPSEAEVLRAAVRHVSASTPGQVLEAEARIPQVEQRWTLTVRTSRAGEVADERHLDATTCAELADATAVILAMARSLRPNARRLRPSPRTTRIRRRRPWLAKPTSSAIDLQRRVRRVRRPTRWLPARRSWRTAPCCLRRRLAGEPPSRRPRVDGAQSSPPRTSPIHRRPPEPPPQARPCRSSSARPRVLGPREHLRRDVVVRRRRSRARARAGLRSLDELRRERRMDHCDRRCADARSARRARRAPW